MNDWLVRSCFLVGLAYPPDLLDGAVQTVLQQAEVLSARWAA